MGEPFLSDRQTPFERGHLSRPSKGNPVNIPEPSCASRRQRKQARRRRHQPWEEIFFLLKDAQTPESG
eukprot:NODE_1051_length_1129_cov_62.297222_g804_i0.p1 GENE.NODE_1051_length_1129_cov_62.297222_g804_i0~~NODE_1051_length_1129_cov_62.297222_g804_i0.p1  ORF type:complete len:68 (-),score=0.36 NODE_1051_length_1129_cov_62.297222_g804_i0:475-678(-)